MDREETIKVLMTIQAAYPNYKPPDKSITVNLWSRMLRDYTYQQVEAAVDAVLSEGWRTPDIAEPGVTPIGTQEMGRRIREAL